MANRCGTGKAKAKCRRRVEAKVKARSRNLGKAKVEARQVRRSKTVEAIVWLIIVLVKGRVH